MQCKLSRIQKTPCHVFMKQFDIFLGLKESQLFKLLLITFSVSHTVEEAPGCAGGVATSYKRHIVARLNANNCHQLHVDPAKNAGYRRFPHFSMRWWVKIYTWGLVCRSSAYSSQLVFLASQFCGQCALRVDVSWSGKCGRTLWTGGRSRGPQSRRSTPTQRGPRR